jgi:hypothetical protein
MRLFLAIAALSTLLAGCTSQTYTSNLAFDLTQRSYVADRKAEAVVVSYAGEAAQDDCSDLVVC